MGRKQVLIALGMLAAVIACLAAASIALRSPAILVMEGPAERLVFAVRWLLVPGLCLLAGVGLTANRRFFSAAAIDGGRPVDDGSFEINLRYNQNTLEQTVLAAVAWTGLALALPASQLNLIPAMAGLFAVGRAAFWLGYLAAPWARAFGLGLTFYPTAAALVWLAFRALR
ncbi:MAG: hypothetical protein ABI655_14475 [Phenylobacterium sp.]